VSYRANLLLCHINKLPVTPERNICSGSAELRYSDECDWLEVRGGGGGAGAIITKRFIGQPS
jgi:hypothetical protein